MRLTETCSSLVTIRISELEIGGHSGHSQHIYSNTPMLGVVVITTRPSCKRPCFCDPEPTHHLTTCITVETAGNRPWSKGMKDHKWQTQATITEKKCESLVSKSIVKEAIVEATNHPQARLLHHPAHTDLISMWLSRRDGQSAVVWFLI